MDRAAGEVISERTEPTDSAAPAEGKTPEAERLKADIAQTRADIGGTIEALQEKLNPTHLAEQAKAAVREATIGKVETMVHNAEQSVSDTGRSMLDTVRQNPIPAIMVGFGLAWLYMSRRRTLAFDEGRGNYRFGSRVPGRADYRGRDYRGGMDYRASDYRGEMAGDEGRSFVDRAEDVAHTVGEKAERAAGDVAHKAGELAERAGSSVKQTTREAGQAASRLAHEAYEGGRRLENRAEDVFYGNPIAVGAVVLAAGTAVGLAIPISHKEDEWMGEARDKVMGRVGEMAKEAIGKVQDAAGKVQEVAGTIGGAAGAVSEEVGKAVGGNGVAGPGKQLGGARP